MENCVAPDQTPRSAASDQGLYCLFMPVCRKKFRVNTIILILNKVLSYEIFLVFFFFFFFFLYFFVSHLKRVTNIYATFLVPYIPKKEERDSKF